jgi:hypothetical protein
MCSYYLYTVWAGNHVDGVYRGQNGIDTHVIERSLVPMIELHCAVYKLDKHHWHDRHTHLWSV